jgi:CheY-like chemotaxis protein
MILDLGLPDEDGLELLRRLRQQGEALPVLVLTARRGQRPGRRAAGRRRRLPAQAVRPARGWRACIPWCGGWRGGR